MPYTVTCTLCSFEYEMDELDDVLDFEDEHQRKYGDDHVIEFQLIR
jgi:hypothetical protein